MPKGHGKVGFTAVIDCLYDNPELFIQVQIVLALVPPKTNSFVSIRRLEHSEFLN